MLAFRPMMVNLSGRRCLVVGDSLALFEHSAHDLLRQTSDARVSVRKARE
jgi:hypothetical protein